MRAGDELTMRDTINHADFLCIAKTTSSAHTQQQGSAPAGVSRAFAILVRTVINRAAFPIPSGDMYLSSASLVSVWFVHCACAHCPWDSRQDGVARLFSMRNAGCTVHKAQVTVQRSEHAVSINLTRHGGWNRLFQQPCRVVLIFNGISLIAVSFHCCT